MRVVRRDASPPSQLMWHCTSGRLVRRCDYPCYTLTMAQILTAVSYPLLLLSVYLPTHHAQ